MTISVLTTPRRPAASWPGRSVKAAIWARVSTTEQEAANQVAQLREVADRRGWEVVAVHQTEASAFHGWHRKDLRPVLRDARAHRFDVLLVWSLDRLTREGPLETLQVVDQLTRAGVLVVSLQEPWVEVSGELRDLLLALVGWMARWESQRRSERTKAGLARALAEGKSLGRQPGAKDKRQRKRSGYVARWEQPGERERARERALRRKLAGGTKQGGS